nr:type II toxin-antitoxin system RelE/ParE family toxin [Candidatus Mycobacterium methanotrophicum]
MVREQPPDPEPLHLSVSADGPYQVAVTTTATENPPRLGKALRNESLHSARRGDYRVIYAVDDASRRLEIIHIDRRSDISR